MKKTINQIAANLGIKPVMLRKRIMQARAKGLGDGLKLEPVEIGKSGAHIFDDDGIDTIECIMLANPIRPKRGFPKGQKMKKRKVTDGQG